MCIQLAYNLAPYKEEPSQVVHSCYWTSDFTKYVDWPTLPNIRFENAPKLARYFKENIRSE